MIEFNVRATSPNPVPHPRGDFDFHCYVMERSSWRVIHPLPDRTATHLSGNDKVSHQISQGFHSSKCLCYKQIITKSEIGEEKHEKVGDNYLDKNRTKLEHSLIEARPIKVLRFYVIDFTLSAYFK